MLVFFSIFLLLAILLACPLVLKASFIGDTGLSVKLSYLLFPILSIPSKEEKKKPPKKPKKEKESTGDKNNRIREIIEKKGLSGFLELLKELAKILGGTTGKILSHTVISNLSLHVVVTADDPADTAIRYGQACSVIYPVMSILVNNGKCRRYKFDVLPGFDPREGKNAVNFSIKVRISPFFLVSAALTAAFCLIKVAVKAGIIKKKDTDDSISKNKAVKSK